MARREAHPDELLSIVADAIDRDKLISPGRHVVVGVSGGMDSAVLLAVLAELAGQAGRDYRLTVAHLNHCLRAGADEDERFVVDLAGRMQLPLRTQRSDVRARAEREGVSIETAARAARYEFLTALAGELGAECVAVGHHADDDVETVLHRILRGTHLRGLAGIPVARDLGGGVKLVRPLLACRRDELHAYAHRRDLAWRTDQSNADTSYTRNLIRHELLEMLRQRVNPRVDEALLRLARTARQAEDYLAELGGEALAGALAPDQPPEFGDAPSLSLDREPLAAAPPIVRTYALRAALEKLGVSMRNVGADQLAELAATLADDGPAAVELPGRVLARREEERLVITRRGACAAEDAPVAACVALNCPGRTRLAGGRAIIAEAGPLDRAAFDAHCAQPTHGVHFFDADCLTGPLTARPRREGDAFRPLGSPGTQSVGDFLTNAKLPRRQRDEVLCVCDDLGIVCVAPLRIDERVKVTSATDRAVVLKVSHADGA